MMSAFSMRAAQKRAFSRIAAEIERRSADRRQQVPTLCRSVAIRHRCAMGREFHHDKRWEQSRLSPSTDAAPRTLQKAGANPLFFHPPSFHSWVRTLTPSRVRTRRDTLHDPAEPLCARRARGFELPMPERHDIGMPPSSTARHQCSFCRRHLLYGSVRHPEKFELDSQGCAGLCCNRWRSVDRDPDGAAQR
jgi:hypothetical protein